MSHIVAKSSAISFTRRAARYTSQRRKRHEIGDFQPSESACEERPWKSPSPRADFLKLAGVRVARGSGAFVYKISCQDMALDPFGYWWRSRRLDLKPPASLPV